MGSLLFMLLGNSAIAGYVRAAVVSGVATLAAKYLPGSDAGAISAGIGALVVGAWSHIAKAVDPAISTASAPAIKSAAVAKGMPGARAMTPIASTGIRDAGDE